VGVGSFGGGVDNGCIDAMYNFMPGESRYRKEMKG